MARGRNRGGGAGVVALIASAVGMSCGDDVLVESATICPTTYLAARLESGSIAFALEGDVPQTHGLMDQDVFMEGLPGNPCRVGRPEAFVRRNGSILFGAYVMCHGGPIYLELDTPRLPIWDPAVVEHESTDATAIVGGTRGSCTYSLRTTSSITRSAGGSLPYPDAVTADFDRRLSVQITGEAAVGEETWATPCPSLTLSAEMQFSETAADVAKFPGALCDIE